MSAAIKTQGTVGSKSVPQWMEIMRRIGLIGYGIGLCSLVSLVVDRVSDRWELAIVGLALVIGYAVADLISGLVHWASDNFGRRDDAIIGQMFVIPFRDHHDDPSAITRETIFELHGINCFNLLPVLGGGVALLELGPNSGWVLLLSGICLGIALGVIAATQIHRWVHQERVPRPVALLQWCGLVISKDAHAIHHCEPHDEYYCIASGWWNRPLYRIQFYRRAERLIERFVGVRPARHESVGQ